MIKVSITTKDGSILIADDSVVERQGTAVYKQICNKEDVLFKDPSNHIVFIPYKNVVMADVSEVVPPTPPEPVKTKIFEGTITTEHTESGFITTLNSPIVLTVGASYEVEFGEGIYNLTAINGDEVVYIGDYNFDEEPFVVTYDAGGPTTTVITFDAVTDAPITIYRIEEEPEPGPGPEPEPEPEEYSYTFTRENMQINTLIEDGFPEFTGYYSYQSDESILLIEGCRYTVTLPDGTTTDPITVVNDGEVNRLVYSDNGEIQFAILCHPGNNYRYIVFNKTAVTEGYNFVVTYVDGGSLEEASWREVLSTTFSTEWSQDYVTEAPNTMMLNPYQGNVFYGKLNDTETLSEDIVANKIYKVDFNGAVFYTPILSANPSYFYGHVFMPIPNNLIGTPLAMDLIVSPEMEGYYGNVAFCTRDKAVNATIKIYKQAGNI